METTNEQHTLPRNDRPIHPYHGMGSYRGRAWAEGYGPAQSGKHCEDEMVDIAKPKFNLSQEVKYLDHHSRLQTGTINRIEASWGFGKSIPLIVYTISHPSYKNKKIYLAEEGLMK